MTDLDDRVIAEARHQGDKLLPVELVELAERYEDDQPGVDREQLRTAVQELYEAGSIEFDAAQFEDVLENRLTDTERWAGNTSVYDLGGGRISSYPPRWHEELADADLETAVQVMAEDIADAQTAPDRGQGRAAGVAETDLLDAVTTLSSRGRDDVQDELRACKAEGRLIEFADQHPEAQVGLPK